MSRFWLCTVFGALSLGGFAAVRDDAGVVVRDSNVVVVQAAPRASSEKPLDGTAIEYTKSFSVTNAGNTHLVFSSTSRMLFTRCVNNTSGVPVFIVNQGDANTTNGEGPYCDTCAGGAALPPVGDAFLRSSVAGPADVRCGFVETWPTGASMSNGVSGGPKGSGAANQLAFWSGVNVLTGSSLLTVDSAAPRISVGNSGGHSSTQRLLADNDGTSTIAAIAHSDLFGPGFTVVRSRNTHAAPAAVQSGDSMGAFTATAFDDTSYIAGGALTWFASENWASAGAHRGNKAVLTTLKPASAGQNSFTFESNGGFTFGSVAFDGTTLSAPALTTTGPVLLPVGSAAAPALAFSSSPNDGYHFLGVHISAFASNGLDVLTLSPTLISTTQAFAAGGDITSSAGAFITTTAHGAGGILQGTVSGTPVDGDKLMDIQVGHMRADFIDSTAAVELGADVLRVGANSLYVATVPRTLPSCTSSLRGALFYKEDTDTAGTAPALCLCSRDNAALTYSYKVLSGTGTCP